MPGLSGTDNSNNHSPLPTPSSNPHIPIHSNNSIPTCRNSSNNLRIPSPVSLAHTILLLITHTPPCPRYLRIPSPWSLLLTYPVLIPSVLESVFLPCTHHRLRRLLRAPLIVLRITNSTKISTRNILLLLSTHLILWTRADGLIPTSLMLINTTRTTNNLSLCSSCDLSRAEIIFPTLHLLLQTPGSK